MQVHEAFICSLSLPFADCKLPYKNFHNKPPQTFTCFLFDMAKCMSFGPIISTTRSYRQRVTEQAYTSTPAVC